MGMPLFPRSDYLQAQKAADGYTALFATAQGWLKAAGVTPGQVAAEKQLYSMQIKVSFVVDRRVVVAACITCLSARTEAVQVDGRGLLSNSDICAGACLQLTGARAQPGRV